MKILNSYKPELNSPQGNQLKKYSQNKSLIFLLRHGQIKGFSEKRYIGRTDVALDDMGVLQAQYWKNQFAPISIETIHSSSLTRCINTAESIAQNTDIITEPALNEINMGTWDEKTFTKIKTEHPDDFKKRGEKIDTFRPPMGESFYDLSCRTLPFFKNLSDTMGGSNTLIVTHAGVIRTILCKILKMELRHLFQLKIAYGELFVINNSDQ